MAKSYGLNLLGEFKIQEVATLPSWSASDERRIIYVADSDKMYYGTSAKFSEFSGGGGTSLADMYSDLLDGSIYQNATYDDMTTEALTDAGNTTMDYSLADERYNFTTTEVLQSDDLFDSTLTATLSATGLTDCLVSVNYVDSGTPTIQVTTDGTNWETVTNNAVKSISSPGTTLKIRFTAGGTGYVDSWAVYYNAGTNLDTVKSNTIRGTESFYYEGLAQDEDTIIDGIYFDKVVSIDAITLMSRVSPSGANITTDITIAGVEQTKIATLTAGATYEKTTLGTALVVALTDRFGLKFKTVGSAEEGQGIEVLVHYTYSLTTGIIKGDGIENYATLPTWTADFEGKVIYVESNDEYYGADGVRFRRLQSNWNKKTTAYTAVRGDKILADTADTAAFTVTLPSSAVIGDTVHVRDSVGNFNSANLTIGRNGHNIRGTAGNLIIDVDWADVELIYVDSTTGWGY